MGRFFTAAIFLVTVSLFENCVGIALPELRVHGPQVNFRQNMPSEPIFFDGEVDTARSSSTAAGRDLTTTSQQPAVTPSAMDPNCESNCPVTPEYNPICATDGISYDNPGKFNCARLCGKGEFSWKVCTDDNCSTVGSTRVVHCDPNDASRYEKVHCDN